MSVAEEIEDLAGDLKKRVRRFEQEHPTLRVSALKILRYSNRGETLRRVDVETRELR